MMNNFNIKRTSVADRIENVKPQISAEKVVGSGDYNYIPQNTDTGLPVQKQESTTKMNSFLKYGLYGVVGAVVVFIGYKYFIKKK
jgi:hypothetical protein